MKEEIYGRGGGRLRLMTCASFNLQYFFIPILFNSGEEVTYDYDGVRHYIILSISLSIYLATTEAYG